VRGDERRQEQDGDGHDIGRAVDPERVIGGGEEVIVGERGGDCGNERGPAPGEQGGGEHGRKVDEVHRRIAPARGDDAAKQGRRRHQKQSFGIAERAGS
jgi:hypothetical protein